MSVAASQQGYAEAFPDPRVDASRAPPRAPAAHPGWAVRGLAVVTAVMVLPLVVVGAGVTSKGAGMAYPDGFTADGYFLRNPPGWWDRDDTRWEHGHRLLGRTVGILSIALAIGCWPYGGAVRALGLANLALIVVQGVLGAFRVNEVSTALAMVHGIFGQICFCVACCVVLVTGRSWPHRAAHRVREAVFLRRLCLASLAVVFAQLVSGAAYRHFGSQGALLVHVLGPIAVTCLVGWVAMWAAGLQGGAGPVARLGQAVAVLMVIQLLLGGFAFTVVVMGGEWSALTRWAAPSAHVAAGALLLAGMVLLSVCTFHLVESREP